MNIVLSDAELARISNMVANTIMKQPGASKVSPMTTEVVDELKSELRQEMRSNASPWVDRKGAAAYCLCSVQLIDKCRATGDIQTYWRAETPMFKKADLDAWIENGKQPTPKGFGREAVTA